MVAPLLGGSKAKRTQRGTRGDVKGNALRRRQQKVREDAILIKSMNFSIFKDVNHSVEGWQGVKPLPPFQASMRQDYDNGSIKKILEEQFLPVPYSMQE